jgi:hypothetical protein
VPFAREYAEKRKTLPTEMVVSMLAPWFLPRSLESGKGKFPRPALARRI